MEALLCGTPNPDTSDEKNTCATDNIANPDNLSVVDDHALLFIGGWVGGWVGLVCPLRNGGCMLPY